MDAAARRPSSPPLTAWLGFGLAVVTIVLALRLRRGAPTWAHRLGSVCPHAVVRHPACLGSILLTAGFARRAPRPGFVAAAVAAITGFVLQTREEDRNLRRRFGSARNSWARDVPGLPLPAGLLRLARRRPGTRSSERGTEP